MNTETMPDWSMQTASDVASHFDSPATGLSDEQARARVATHGPNKIDEQQQRSKAAILGAQFRGFLTYVLGAAALISAILGDWIEALAILAIVVLNAIMGYVQETKAEEAMAALKQMAVPFVRVKRSGSVEEISSLDVVPGDRILIETGNVAPADGRLSDASNLRVDESMLTGESEPVTKDAWVVLESPRALAERRNMVYSGTTITAGRGEVIATATGMDSELGKIASLIQGVEEGRTPLQERLDHLGKVLAAVAGALVALLFVMGLIRGDDLETLLLTSVSLAVAAIPEAMPAVVTIALSLGAQRMLKRNALIRSLPAVETLGSVSVIGTDKTGTLTENRMTAVVLDVAEHRLDLPSTSQPADIRPTIELALLVGVLCNDAALSEGVDGFTAIGDPTEGALVVAGAQAGLTKPDIERALPRIAEIPFESTRKRMTTIHRTPEGTGETPDELRDLLSSLGGQIPEYVACTKGAVGGLVERSDRVWVNGIVNPIDPGWITRIETAEEGLASKGMRVLGLAVRPLSSPEATEDVESSLVFVGMFGIIDPPRASVPGAVTETLSAGIRPVMITGDHPLTARHIAHTIGIKGAEEVIVGPELDAMSEDELKRVAQDVSVFARVSPEHKLELISALQSDGELVAMTGDGVNDAPALKGRRTID